jgi:hypothetical protein
MNKVKFIITRYREKEDEFSWIKLVDNFIIFNKGNAEDLSPELQKWTINKKNVGKDLEVILSYIIDNYNQLEDTIVFTQANIRPHYFYHDEAFVSLITDVDKKGFSDKFISEYEAPEELSGFPRVPKEFLNHPEFNLAEYPTGKKLANYHPSYNLKTWWEKYTGEKYIQNKRIFWGCIFGIKKELILRRSKSFYEILRKPLLNDSNPVETQFLERTWANIFKIENFNL